MRCSRRRLPVKHDTSARFASRLPAGAVEVMMLLRWSVQNDGAPQATSLNSPQQLFLQADSLVHDINNVCIQQTDSCHWCNPELTIGQSQHRAGFLQGQSCQARSRLAYRQQGQFFLDSSHSARHDPQNECPQGAKECAATIQSRQMTHSRSFSSLSTRSFCGASCGLGSCVAADGPAWLPDGTAGTPCPCKGRYRVTRTELVAQVVYTAADTKVLQGTDRKGQSP